MRIMGIDYGTVRTGIAISDPSGTIAQPAGYIKSSSLKDLSIIILNQCKEKGIKKVVLGLPLHMNGQESKGAEEVRKLGSFLRQDSDISIVFWEERLSTCAAERVLIEGNASRARRKKNIDSIAAAIILQNYLESLNNFPD